MKKIAIIANGKHKKALKLKSDLSKLLPEAYSIIDKHTDNPGHATELTLDAINEGADYLIAAGGDGTMNEVINGIMQSTDEQRLKVIVGLFPLGTGNDFARTAQLTKSVKELANLIISEKYQKIDLGQVEYKTENGEPGIRYFNNIAEAAKEFNRPEETIKAYLRSKKSLRGFVWEEVRAKPLPHRHFIFTRSPPPPPPPPVTPSVYSLEISSK